MREWGDAYITKLVVLHLGASEPSQILVINQKKNTCFSFLALVKLDAVWDRGGQDKRDVHEAYLRSFMTV